MMLGGLDPELVAQIKSILGPQPGAGLPAMRSTAGAVAPRPPAPPPDDERDAWDVFQGIVTSPFRLVGAAKRGLEDALGHRNSVMRDQQEAEYDATLKYLLASQSIPDEIKQMLPIPQADRSGYTSRQTSTTGTATGRNYEDYPVPTPRKTGIWEWITGEERQQRARDEATVQAAMKLAGYDLALQDDQAEIRRKTFAGDASQAQALKTGAETDLLYRYGDLKNLADIDQSRAAAQSSRASAGASNAARGKYLAETAGIYEDQDMQRDQYWNVDRPGEVAKQGRDAQMFQDVTYPAGRRALQQRVAMDPIEQALEEAKTLRELAASDSSTATARKTNAETDLLLRHGDAREAAETRRALLAGDASGASALQTDYKTELLYRYGDDEHRAEIDARRALAGSRAASASRAETAREVALDRNARDAAYHDQVRMPGGLAGMDQREQAHRQRMETGGERLRQLREMGPLNAQAKQADIARSGGGEIPRDYVSAVKGVNVALNQARDDAQKKDWWWTKADERRVADPILRQFGVPMRDDGEPDWDGYVEKFHAKPTTPTPAAPVAATKPTGAERYRVYDLLKKKFPGLADGVISSRADVISEAMPRLDFSTEDAFIDSAELAGLNDEEMVILWNDRNP